MKRMFSIPVIAASLCSSILIALGSGSAMAAIRLAPGAPSMVQAVRPRAAGTAPTVKNCDGREEQFAVGSGGHLYHRYQSKPGGSYGSWYSLGGVLVYSAIGAVVNANCHVEVFGVGQDYAMWHIWQTRAGSGPWSRWASMGGAFAGGPFQAFVDTNNEAVVAAPWYYGGDACDNQEHPSSGPWSGWYACTPV
jgi:hypothetical protein